jgi:tetratricopeptide (TPR) repeat protein
MILAQVFNFATNQPDQPPVAFLHSFVLFHSSNNLKLPQDELKKFFEDVISILRWYGEALIGEKEHARAREYLKQAKEIIKHLPGVPTEQSRTHEHFAPILELIGDCYTEASDVNNAINALEEIPNRNVSANMKLANLYRTKGKDQDAIECFQSVLRKDRYVLTAAEALIQLGLPESQKKDLKAMYVGTQDEWVRRWIDTKFELEQKNNHREALIALDKLQMITQRVNNLESILDTAYCRFMLYENDKALELFERASKIDEYNVYRMDTFARLLSSTTAPLLLSSHRQQSRLSTLARTVTHNNPKAPETQLIMAVYYQQLSRRNTDENQQTQQQQLALKLANRAIQKYEKRNHRKYAEGLLVKAEILMSISRFDEAVLCYHALHVFCKDIRIYEGLVKCYLSIPQHKDAFAAANMALKLYPNNPHTQILQGTVLLSKAETLPNAKQYFEKAIKMLGIETRSTSVGDLYTIEKATLGLAEYYTKNQQYPEAIKVLNDQLRRNDSDLIHCKLGDAYTQSGPISYEIALSHYHTALSKNPQNALAKEGLANLERVLHPPQEEEEVQEEIDDIDEEDQIDQSF